MQHGSSVANIGLFVNLSQKCLADTVHLSFLLFSNHFLIFLNSIFYRGAQKSERSEIEEQSCK